ncbi:SDR family NAD(P)-dependent oxidoreductase [Microbacterium alcoholitolerans]|uniref:SDR family NAD(P)-dependent oxidoreductase n=1 Tax=unclassified Microbacterium TaxID=2609290 RepID=UPI003D167AEE
MGTGMTGRWSGRRALVTGASSGVGLEIARALAAGSAHVILPVRDRSRGDAAMRSIRESVPDASLEVRDLDLADFASVAALGKRLRAEGAPIELYVMNAGIILLGDGERHVTVDGHELHLQTNFLGHAALTRELMPLLCAGRARVAVQLSLAAARGRLDDLECKRRYSAWRAYAGSKRALGLWGAELARRSAAEGWGLNVNLCHPGVAPDTGIAVGVRRRPKGGETGGRAQLARRLGSTPAQAAEPALMALASDAGIGKFYVPGGTFGMSGAPRERALFRALRDADAARRMWEFAEMALTRGLAG